MRTTLTLSDEAAEYAATYARARAIRLGEAVSELVMKAKTPQTSPRRKPFKTVNGIPQFPVPNGAKTITSEDVRAALEDE